MRGSFFDVDLHGAVAGPDPGGAPTAPAADAALEEYGFPLIPPDAREPTLEAWEPST
jgi:hypothetical protein